MLRISTIVSALCITGCSGDPAPRANRAFEAVCLAGQSGLDPDTADMFCACVRDLHRDAMPNKVFESYAFALAEGDHATAAFLWNDYVRDGQGGLTPEDWNARMTRCEAVAERP